MGLRAGIIATSPASERTRWGTEGDFGLPCSCFQRLQDGCWDLAYGLHGDHDDEFRGRWIGPVRSRLVPVRHTRRRAVYSLSSPNHLAGIRIDKMDLGRDDPPSNHRGKSPERGIRLLGTDRGTASYRMLAP
jgi:hypothetical protein